jgi:hypothetical protein
MDDARNIIDDMFKNYFASGDQEYGVNVIRLSENESKIDACVTFKKDHRYCCSEITCHFKPDWSRIREKAQELGLALNTPLSVEFHIVVEDGTLLEVNSSIGLPLATEAQEYTWCFQEK